MIAADSAADLLRGLAGRSVADPAVPTPLVYVDRAVLERNIARMAAAARETGVALRPHVKSHKVAEIARLQLAAGATGLTVAKLGEAQALAAAGVDAGFMVAQPAIGGGRAEALLALARDLDREVIACVDDLEPARELAAAAVAGGTVADVVLIVDTGYGRLGVSPAEAAGLAARLADEPGLRFRGIRSHSGRAYTTDGLATRRDIAATDAGAMREIAAAIVAGGGSCEIVSVGSTPGTAGLADPATFQGVTEWRPGNYVFFDRAQVEFGAATGADCALTVIASVVSARPGRGVIDAGRKTLSSTAAPTAAGFGGMVDRPDVQLHALSEECGWLRSDAQLAVGDRLRIVPNHACELPNLAEAVAYGTDGVIEGAWVPVARGKVW